MLKVGDRVKINWRETGYGMASSYTDEGVVRKIRSGRIEVDSFDKISKNFSLGFAKSSLKKIQEDKNSIEAQAQPEEKKVRTFRVNYRQTEYGSVSVEARDEEEARQMVYDGDIEYDWQDSDNFEIDDITEE